LISAFSSCSWRSSTGRRWDLGLQPVTRQAEGLSPWDAMAAPSLVSYFRVRSLWKKVNKTCDGVIKK